MRKKPRASVGLERGTKADATQDAAIAKKARKTGALRAWGLSGIERALTVLRRRSGVPRQPSESTHAMVRQKKPRAEDTNTVGRQNETAFSHTC